MYRIIDADTELVIGYVDTPRYIRVSAEGNFVQTDAEHAQGIAYHSTAYNLRGREGIGVEKTLDLFEVDLGDMIADLVAQAEMVPVLEDALCEQDAAIEERLAEIEDALCELDIQEEE